MIRIDAMWLAIEPVDMRSGADRLPMHPNRSIDELLPHRWKAAGGR